MGPSKQAVGHLDKRKALTRCQPCARRKIKCHGGIPCEYCIRTGKTCEPQAPPRTRAAFQFVTQESSRDNSSLALCPAICPAVDDDRTSIYLSHFVAVVLGCRFTASFPSAATALLPVMAASEHLRDIAVAIGALDANRRAQVGTSHRHPGPRIVAFKRYHRALVSLQGELASSDAPQRDDVLWTTFLLGLFELMAEPTGDRWARHMLYGTGRMLQCINMDSTASPLKQILFEAFRILEANRAIMYGVDTFLSENRWAANQTTRLTPDGQDVPRPMDDIITLMIYTASFSQRFFDQINQIPEPARRTHPAIEALGIKGLHVQGVLNQWYLQHSAALEARDPTHESKLALVYYHTLVLFLSRNYTYYPYWAGKPTPLLGHAAVADHARHVVDLMDELQKSEVPGVMLLFPLRVVGSLLDSEDARLRLMKLLDAIYRKGYVVAERIKVDLEELWAVKRLEGVGC